MLPLFVAPILVAVTVVIHAIGFSLLLRYQKNSRAALPTQVWPISLLFISMTWLLILIHSAEITLWALAYLWAGCIPDIESAFYYSAITYTTIGYGDLVLQPPWRLLGPIEGLTGILMCGLSAGLFFALANRIYQSRPHTN